MKVWILVDDKCSRDELDNLIKESADYIAYDYEQIEEDLWHVTASMVVKVGVAKYFALKKYAKTKKGKVIVKIV